MAIPSFFKTVSVGLMSSFLVSSCTVGPDYVKPPVVVPPKFKEAKGTLKTAPVVATKWQPIKPCDALDRGEWWKVFQDPLLNDLETQLNIYNQNIANAEANYRQSLAIVDEARASYFPNLAGVFNVSRQKQGGGATPFISTSGGVTTTGVATTDSSAVSRPTTTNYGAVLNATWEPDIWGLVRRTVEANLAVAQSNAALVAVTRLSAQGSLAQYYFELRTLDSNQKLLDDTVLAYKKTLDMTRNRYKSGVASRADIVQAQSQLETAQAQALNNGILRGQYEHAIAVLIGRPPAYFSLKFMPLKLKVPAIPVEIPSVWLERRPDIAQAERLVQNTSALIGVAIAAYYPNLTLTATASAAARSFKDLINTPTIGWSTGLQLAQTFFDGGFRRATVNAAKSAYMAQVAAYRQTVLTAFQDVEDMLIALRILKEQSIVQNKAAASAQLALKLVLNQYKAGTVAYIDVLASQVLAYNAQKAANDVNGLQMTAAVGLIKALGGGWNMSSQ
ncbi:efflux transporter outer membrane subunit [Legionella shakespearei]|uniref:Outer membrane efflux protein n=1 Tax=Legionella shakespearei DSM 23087 TaxID=1122169 RepID=A0A0W0Z767_9GAMM|nr:efflux transporter outer membrane subunit [Legionella shakespearei]KTD64952.1 outer membrane efflux protein [Legionella shakespearei DSM 23087]